MQDSSLLNRINYEGGSEHEKIISRCIDAWCFLSFRNCDLGQGER